MLGVLLTGPGQRGSAGTLAPVSRRGSGPGGGVVALTDVGAGLVGRRVLPGDLDPGRGEVGVRAVLGGEHPGVPGGVLQRPDAGVLQSDPVRLYRPAEAVVPV